MTNSATDAARPGRVGARFREFHVCVIDDAGHRYLGEGMTLDRVVEAEVERHRGLLGLAVANGSTAAEFAAEEPDRIIWEGFRVAGILRPGPDGSLRLVGAGGDPESGTAEHSPARVIEPGAGASGPIEESYRVLLGLLDRRKYIDERGVVLQAELDRVEAEDEANSLAVRHEKANLITLVMDGRDRDVDEPEFFWGVGPLATHHSGGVTFHVVRAGDGNYPETFAFSHDEEVLGTLQVVIVEEGR